MLSFTFKTKRAVFVKSEDGSVKEISDVVGVAFDIEDEAVVRLAKATPRLREPKEKAAPNSTKNYSLGDVDISDETARRYLKGECDTWAEGQGNVRRDELLRVLTFMRIKLFSLASATFDVRDAQTVAHAMKEGVKPSSLCKALVAASRDEWWKKQGDIGVMSLVKHVGKLSSSKRVSEVDWRERLRKMLEKILQLDAFEAAQIEAALPTMTIPDARAFVETWTKKLAR